MTAISDYQPASDLFVLSASDGEDFIQDCDDRQ